MESKLTALFIILLFISLTVIGLILKFALAWDFALDHYFQYLILLSFALMVLGRPLIKMAIDLVQEPYRQNEGHFKLPGEKLPREPVAPTPAPKQSPKLKSKK